MAQGNTAKLKGSPLTRKSDRTSHIETTLNKVCFALIIAEAMPSFKEI